MNTKDAATAARVEPMVSQPEVSFQCSTCTLSTLRKYSGPKELDEYDSPPLHFCTQCGTIWIMSKDSWTAKAVVITAEMEFLEGNWRRQILQRDSRDHLEN